jgi:hypothetical protein
MHFPAKVLMHTFSIMYLLGRQSITHFYQIYYQIVF